MKKVHIVISVAVVLLLLVGFSISSIATVSDTPITEKAEPQVEITGSRVLFRVDFRHLFSKENIEEQSEESVDAEPQLIAPFYMLTITETQVNSLLVLLILFLLCIWLTRDLKVVPTSKRQIVAEFIVEKMENMIRSNMSESFVYEFAPFITALIGLSGLSSLTSLLGWKPPTGDLNTIIGWSIVVFILITHQKLRAGAGSYLGGFLKPIPLMLPMNILGEISTPFSMTFRHFGNVCSGTVISALLTYCFTLLSNALWNLVGVTGILSDFAIFRIGIPAIFSIYFDIFSGCLQAFIFCMLTMINIYVAYEDSNETLLEKQKKREKKLQKAMASQKA